MVETTVKPWIASDDINWIQHLHLGEWSGWIPGEDGSWHLTDEEFRTWYPDEVEMIPRSGYDYPTTAEVLAGGQSKGKGFF